MVLVLDEPADVCALAPAPLAVIARFTPAQCAAALPFPVLIGDAELDVGERVTAVLQPPVEVLDTVADFSAAGPTVLNIVKPDVVAPGSSIMAPRQGQAHCENLSAVAGITGTSAATPFVAGAALLAQQYFQDGYYPSGSPVDADSFRPSGNLLRALLVASADQPGGTHPRHPSPTSGHGVVNLANVLPFDTGMRVVEQMTIALGEDLSWTVSVEQSERSLRIAMAYLDTDGWDVGLRIDLDLFVVLPNRSIVYGNMRPNSREERFSTVERIVLWPSELEDGPYEVHVVGHGRIAETPTQVVAFSLIIVGPLLDTPFNVTRSTIAACQAPSIGNGCQIVPFLITNHTLHISMPPNSLEYFRFEPPASYELVQFHFQRPDSSTYVADFRFTSLRVPLALSDYGFAFSSDNPYVIMGASRFVIGASKICGIAMTNISPREINVSVWAEIDPEETEPTGTSVDIPQSSAASQNSVMVTGGFVAAIVLAVFFSITTLVLAVALWVTRHSPELYSSSPWSSNHSDSSEGDTERDSGLETPVSPGS
jgi:hypothetical protein